LNEGEQLLAEKFWPGALTLILTVSSTASYLGETEGVRVPAHGVVRDIIARVGGLLRVTSANLSGDRPALDAVSALKAFEHTEVEGILDDGPVMGGTASTVARVDMHGRIEILRKGALPGELLRGVLSKSS